jgi:putative phosphoesterase
VRALVVADTHVRPGSSRRLPPGVYAELEQADVVLHAGDVLTVELLDELGGYAPVHAVLGNNDHTLAGALAETWQGTLGGVAVGMVHDSGPARGRAGRLARRFPDCAVVVFGHSHLPQDEAGIDGQRLFNPGSPTERRRAPTRTVGRLVMAGGELVDHRIIDV